MSAPLYNTAIPPVPRRHPLASVNPHVANQGRHHPPPRPATPPKQQEQPKQQSSPPLPRQNAKVPPPSPPKIIVDKTRSLEFMRVGMLGEGGFARVYEVQDNRGQRSACKVVTKSSLKTKKAKTKLYAEIKIHKSLDHPNIVRFQECFEDTDNVYMTLELCHNGSLMDMLRRRRRFTEPEARFFMVQLIGACHYMHTHQVIHRDLKLGNIFLDRNMNVKVGDFGLAALIEQPGERKKTICGTPNYIAPEVLFDTVNGHSFEVDTWSIGVILYTLVIGRPPFQTKDVKAIYTRIRENDYEFPADRIVSSLVQELIQQILTPDPQQRPTLHEIVDHKWFTSGIVPPYIPTSAHDGPPDFSHVVQHVSTTNLSRLRRQALLDDDQTTSIAVPSAPSASGAPTKRVTSTLAQQEKEFQKAVQPGSPISALLSSARQPLIVAPQANPGGSSARITEQPLLRKLQAAKDPSGVKSPPRARNNNAALIGIAEQDEAEPDGFAARVHEIRTKEIESQKARIVAQMVPAGPPSATGSVFGFNERGERERGHGYDDEENVPPPSRTRDAARLLKEKEREKEREQCERAYEREREKEKERERMREEKREQEKMKEWRLSEALAKEREQRPRPDLLVKEQQRQREEMPPPAGLPIRQNGFDAAAQTLCTAFDALSMGRLFRDPREDANLPDAQPFIVSWVDYCNKYGMGYALTDGSVGVYFNDSTTMVLSADKCHFDYITSRRQGSVYVRKNHTVADYPEELKSKVYLLKHFERYIMDRLYGDHDYVYEDLDRTKGMDFVQKYLRMKHVIVFKLSHDVLQFNFYDHSKVILSASGRLVTHIDRDYALTRYTLADVCAAALRPPHPDPERAKFAQRLVDKLKYCKEVLVSIRAASQVAAGTSDIGDLEPPLMASVPSGIPSVPSMAPSMAQSIASRSSKGSLR